MSTGRAVEWTDEMDQKVRSMWFKYKRYEVARELGVSEVTLYRRAKALGLDMKQQQASMGGKISTDNMIGMRSTKDFEKRYAAVAKRRGWVVRDDYKRAG
jgi:hypothetical protein